MLGFIEIFFIEFFLLSSRATLSLDDREGRFVSQGISFYCDHCKMTFVPKCVPCREAPRTSCPSCNRTCQKVKTVERPPESLDVGPDVPGGGAT